MECHDSQPQLGHGVPWLANPVTKFEVCLTSKVRHTPLVCSSTMASTPNQRPMKHVQAKKLLAHSTSTRVVHDDSDASDTSARESVSRVMRGRHASHVRGRVADVRKNSVADGCGLTARIR